MGEPDGEKTEAFPDAAPRRPAIAPPLTEEVVMPTTDAHEMQRVIERAPPVDPGEDRTREAIVSLGADVRVVVEPTGPEPFIVTTADVDAIDKLLLGTRLDAYLIRDLLGKGGMGRVYRAWHERLHRESAVKVLDPQLVEANPDRLEMFWSEARAVAHLHHPNLVAIHSLGNDRGFPFIEMELVDGPSLSELLRTVKAANGGTTGLDPLLATKYAAQIAAALHEAHRHHVVHGDVKPDNVILNSAGVAKLTDFGLARTLSNQRNRTGGRVSGTPAYMAPEMFAGVTADAATDVYALGVTYFLLLTGWLPRPAEGLTDLTVDGPDFCKRLYERLPDCPAESADLLAAMLAYEPASRPKCDAALASRLHEIANGLTNTREIVAAAVSGSTIEWTADGERFEFLVRLAGDRRQRVFAEVVDGEGTAGRIFALWTPCAPADIQHYELVLRLNARLPHGAVSLRPHGPDGRPYFVMVDNYPRSSLDPEEIRASVVHMAEWADFIEHQLTGQDHH
ncbi:MAG: serine/threonine-protein kinase [Planctomycetia bacterium]